LPAALSRQIRDKPLHVYARLVREKWLTADYSCKRRILENICLNFSLDDTTLCYEMRKPFDVLAEGLVSEKSRGDWTSIELFLAGIRGWELGLRRRIGLQIQ
jgi:hypothetical protein